MSWYVDFFTELPNEFWRRAAGPELTAADVSFVERQLALPPRARILDAPCGSGRHSLALAKAGYRVTGLDISAEAIGHARRAAAAAKLDRQPDDQHDHQHDDQHNGKFDVELIIADMRELPQTGDFDAAICMGNSFGYFPTAELRQFIAALAGAVRPGGGLVVDFNATAESVLSGPIGAPRVMRTGDITVDAVTEYDVAGSRLLSRYHFQRGTESLRATAVHHVYTSGHLGELLSEAGFDVEGRFADPDGTPFTVGAGRLLLVARRASATRTATVRKR